MTFSLPLPPDLEQRLTQAAEFQKLSIIEYALRLFDRYLPPKKPKTELLNLLQSWIDEEDDGEQQETGAELIQSLDEHRLSSRPLFPPELKGVSW
jgi:hypothetical protein